MIVQAISQSQRKLQNKQTDPVGKTALSSDTQLKRLTQEMTWNMSLMLGQASIKELRLAPMIVLREIEKKLQLPFEKRLIAG